MNRWHGLVLSLLLAILCLAPAASAQVEGPHLGFSAQGGGNFWTGGKPLENDLIYGGRLALMPWSRVGVEGTVELHPTQRAGGNDFRVTHLSADAIVEILPFHRLNPYLTAGLTRLHVDDLGAGEENWNGWEIGGGLLVALANAEGRQVDLRLDLRRVVSERKSAGPNDDNFPTNWIATLGLRFALGANPADGDADGVPDRSDR
ncbi:MAG TPA: outer membrane beta-barrel protein, partial [Candidatus Krumholzibacteria bacterium]|nr:outer membrane beta-barrel protein [Candidatus Krumholzibacteria bacterium]